ncbi:ATP-binding protein [Streptomyces sp. NPDC101118]|uniref:ATP-binding protein n=1 Tax=Streptomyces sp. NPDC101118 TaxID=3366109 RepID=UPI0037F65AF4
MTDPGPTLPRPSHRRPDRGGGHGIFLVDQLVEHWGTRPEGAGKTVWADLSVS